MTIEKYNKLNNSYKKKLVYKYGAEAGFFSEFNNLLLAVVYCLENKIKFCIYCPENALLRFEKGWEDFFEPFCDEITVKTKVVKKMLNSLASRQPISVDKKHKFLGKILKFILRIDYFSYDLWDMFRSEEYIKKMHFIDGIEYSDYFILYHDICRLLFRLTPKCEMAVNTIKKKCGIEQPYVGIHIRMGDKLLEYDLIPLRKYLNLLSSNNSDIKNLYVMTDDYKVVQQIKNANQKFIVFTNCKEAEIGWTMKKYLSWSLDRRFQDNIELLAKVYFLANSEYCIGTYTSNPGMFLGLYMDKGKFLDIDGKSWTVT